MRSSAAEPSMPRLGPAERVMLLIALGTVAFAALSSPTIWPDSSSYILNTVYRPPVYPWLIDLCTFLFGHHGLRAVVVLQTLVCVGGVLRLTQVLRRQLQIAPWPAVAVCLLLATPVPLWTRAILTEAVSYGLFLLLLSELVDACEAEPRRPLLRAAVLVGLLVATRTQLTILVPIVACHGLVVGLYRGRLRLGLGLAALVLLGGAGGSLAQRIANQLENGMFVPAALSGQPVFAQQLYLSQAADLSDLNDPADRQLTKEIRDKLVAKQLLHDSLPGQTDGPNGYQLAADRILYEVVLPHMRTQLGVRELDAAQYVAFDAQALRIAKTLIIAHPLRWLTHAGQQIRTLAGFFVLLSAATAAAGLYMAFGRRQSWGLALAVVALIAVANHVLVGLVHTLQQRYVFIPDIALAAVLAATLLRQSALANCPACSVQPCRAGCSEAENSPANPVSSSVCSPPGG